MTTLRNMTAIYLTRSSRVLLLYRVGSRVVGNSYTGTAGGHFEQEELNDPRACVLRELREETGLTPDDMEGLRLRYVTMRFKNGEIRQNYYYFAELREGVEVRSSAEGRLQWFNWEETLDLPMPFTAKQMLRHYVATGRYTDALYGCISTEMDAQFTEMKDF